MSLANVIYEHVGIEHEDERRRIQVPFNGDFHAKQTKILSTKQGCRLGDHHHNYSELYFVISGQVTFTSEDPQNKDRVTYTMQPGDRLLVPTGIAHRADALENTVLLGFTEVEYQDASNNDIPYKIEL